MGHAGDEVFDEQFEVSIQLIASIKRDMPIWKIFGKQNANRVSIQLIASIKRDLILSIWMQMATLIHSVSIQLIASIKRDYI
ncbi:Chromosome (plasmid) partitioning protein ParB (plasmid) [Leptolyngbya boryana IAM M-101]|nr:Chromosome (plasmid) partitioning protein ParB [Leptolyngbya boryana IAM M-101]BAS66688.1 Chromosome (plasmid) partitioning protein ParB [Leptolyngbya boryana dg5]